MGARATEGRGILLGTRYLSVPLTTTMSQSLHDIW
eukprot:SAG11_NODE_621_length_8169_cov_2.866914_13_plen_35_part_00